MNRGQRSFGTSGLVMCVCKKIENRTFVDNLLKYTSCLFTKLKSFQKTTKSSTHSGILGSFGPDPMHGQGYQFDFIFSFNVR